MTQTLLEKLMPCAARGVSVSKKERGECPNLAPMKRTQLETTRGFYTIRSLLAMLFLPVVLFLALFLVMPFASSDRHRLFHRRRFYNWRVLFGRDFLRFFIQRLFIGGGFGVEALLPQERAKFLADLRIRCRGFIAEFLNV
jgi:hypothetical protein